jgi:ribosomal protein S18 acetylase RimI-like enzyme
MKIDFEIAKDSDMETLLELMWEYYAFEQFPFDKRAARKALSDILHDDSLECVWLIKAENKVIGYIVLILGFSLEYHGRDAIIDELYIKEDYRGQGIGTRAIEFAAKESHSLGINALHLEVERKNTKAQRFYHKIGFEDHDRYLLTKWLK